MHIQVLWSCLPPLFLWCRTMSAWCIRFFLFLCGCCELLYLFMAQVFIKVCPKLCIPVSSVSWSYDKLLYVTILNWSREWGYTSLLGQSNKLSSTFTSLPDVKMAALHAGLVGWILRQTPIRIRWKTWPILAHNLSKSFLKSSRACSHCMSLSLPFLPLPVCARLK